jgi:hypothetical protein
MARLYFTVEGPTEQGFVRVVLKPHLERCRIYCQSVLPAAHCQRHGTPHRGGVIRYQPLKTDICNSLKRDKHADAYHTTMFDLYALPKDFPKFEESRGLADPYKRVAFLEAALGEDIADTRFIPYIQLHEFEAILLASPATFSSYFEDHERQIDNLRKMTQNFQSPELIDDGQSTAPSKRIAAEIPGYLKRKATAGPIIARHIGLDVIRSRCPHFDEWLRKLETLNS